MSLATPFSDHTSGALEAFASKKNKRGKRGGKRNRRGRAGEDGEDSTGPKSTEIVMPANVIEPIDSFIMAGQREKERQQASTKRKNARERAQRRRNKAIQSVAEHTMVAGVLIVDAGAFITGAYQLRGMGRRLVTTPGVMREIRDESSRAALDALYLVAQADASAEVSTSGGRASSPLRRMPPLPQGHKGGFYQEEASPIDVASVREAARATGDLTSLGTADIDILAVALHYHNMWAKYNTPTATNPKVGAKPVSVDTPAEPQSVAYADLLLPASGPASMDPVTAVKHGHSRMRASAPDSGSYNPPSFATSPMGALEAAPSAGGWAAVAKRAAVAYTPTGLRSGKEGEDEVEEEKESEAGKIVSYMEESYGDAFCSEEPAQPFPTLGTLRAPRPLPDKTSLGVVLASREEATATALQLEERKRERRQMAGVEAMDVEGGDEIPVDSLAHTARCRAESGDDQVAVELTAADFADEDEGVWVGNGAAELHDAVAYGMEWVRAPGDGIGPGPVYAETSAGVQANPAKTGMEVPEHAKVAESTTSSASTAYIVPVAMISGDYAVQNTALFLGLAVCGLSGRRVAHRRTWSLRCTACLELCRDLERIFCPQCGNSGTLRRVGVEHMVRIKTGKDGVARPVTEERLILARNFYPRLRGTVFSVPERNSRRAKRRERTRAGIRAARAPAVLADAAAQGRGGEAALGGSSMSAGYAKLGRAGRVGRLLVSEEQLLQGAWASLARGDRKAAHAGSSTRQDLGLVYGAAPAKELLGTGSTTRGGGMTGGEHASNDALRVRGLPRIVVGLGAGNPNARKGRERRGKGGRIR